jgi:uncharacterized protein with FMN-binding domain
LRRVILAIVATAVGLVLLLSFKSHSSSGGLASSTITTPEQNGTGTSTADPSGTAGTGTTSQSGGSKSAGSKSAVSGSGTSKTVDGDSVQTAYGPIQVNITVKDGKITAVNVPVYPQGTERDIQINEFALPELVQETISADSANIDAVSGASYTSQGYISSLQNAIDKAGI